MQQGALHTTEDFDAGPAEGAAVEAYPGRDALAPEADKPAKAEQFYHQQQQAEQRSIRAKAAGSSY